MASNAENFTNSSAWGLLNGLVCSRSSGSSLEQENMSLLQTARAQYSKENLNVADGLGGYGSLAAATATCFYFNSRLGLNLGGRTYFELDDVNRSYRERLMDHRRRRKPEVRKTEAEASVAQPSKEPSQKATTGSEKFKRDLQSQHCGEEELQHYVPVEESEFSGGEVFKEFQCSEQVMQEPEQHAMTEEVIPTIELVGEAVQ